MKRVVNTDCPAQRADDAFRKLKLEYDPVIAGLRELIDDYDENSDEYSTIFDAIKLLERNLATYGQHVSTLHDLRKAHHPEEYED